MTQAFVTVAIPIADKLSKAVENRVCVLGNPASDAIAKALKDSAFVHFISITVMRGQAGSHLILEASADGSARAALARIATTMCDPLREVLEAAGVPRSEPLGAYLERHRINIGPSLFSANGAVLAGTPGVSVRRIRDEAELASRIKQLLDRDGNPEPALRKLERIRNEIFKDAALKWAFFAEPVPLLKPASQRLVVPVSSFFFRKLLWPLVVLPLVAAIVSALATLVHAPDWPPLVSPVATATAYWHILQPALVEGFKYAAVVAGVEIVTAVVLLGVTYRLLRRSEEADAPVDMEPSASDMAQVMGYENQIMQNHLAAVSILKPGWVHPIVLRAVFRVLAALTTTVWRPGYLFDLGSIHFARWLLLPRTNELVFLSNYDGSWESYLEDFIARANMGITAIWSNTCGFPKTRNLINGGASDCERFKRWARRQQHPTRFWYSAYPYLTTGRIRTNAAIRYGLASATTEQAATEWLSHLGFPAPPFTYFESDEIPTLVFGGLSNLTHAHCLIVRLADGGPDACRHWLGEVAKEITYGDRASPNRALVAGFSASGLRKIGLEPALASFPTAFQQGMVVPWRARALGDTGVNSSQNWSWGGPGNPNDAIVVLYATHPVDLQIEVARHTVQLGRYGHNVIYDITLAEVPSGRQPNREPFGSIDGISQPIMRGTRRWAAPHSAIHEVEPGELVLGYPDNLGYVAPSPRYNGFDVGRNGTYLVARQLEQDVDGFERYLDQEAARIATDPRSPSQDPAWLREWIAAKMLGRWRADGSSLVRHPTPPGTPGRSTVASDNAFLFGTEDPNGLRCPFGAHIRRANPRDSLDPGSQVQIGITNRHRILRVGRSYERTQDPLKKRGLLFMCVNTDIEGQFEFLQQTWVLGRDFHGLKDESDPIVHQQQGSEPSAMSIPTPSGALRIARMENFVTVRGGGYFFLPGRSTVQRLIS